MSTFLLGKALQPPEDRPAPKFAVGTAVTGTVWTGTERIDANGNRTKYAIVIGIVLSMVYSNEELPVDFDWLYTIKDSKGNEHLIAENRLAAVTSEKAYLSKVSVQRAYPKRKKNWLLTIFIACFCFMCLWIVFAPFLLK